MTTKLNATTSGLIESVDTSGVLELQTGNVSALVIGTDQNANFTGTTAITVPNGTTAQRPTPVNGMMRYNTSLSIFEVYANNTWSAANVTPTPVNTVAPVISGSAIVGQNLTCTTGTWSGSPSAYYYQWRANSTAISNATANVFTLTLAENGANITCNVTAYNVAGNSTPATSNTLGPVINGTTVTVLMVAGGGGGSGGAGSGGSGGGGLLYGTMLLTPATTYPVVVGAGGVGAASSGVIGGLGANSTFNGATAIGGGVASTAGVLGLDGGSGGGGGGASTNGTNRNGTNATQTNSGGLTGYGNNGSSTYGSSDYAGGGGGGAGAVGGASTSNNGGNGGVGLAYSISGTSTYYAGGGGGGGTGSGGTGGSGGGGNGGNTSINGTNGSASTGGGAGGQRLSNPGANGGSGIVIISYSGAQQFGGGVISTDGSNTIHTFYTSGSLVPLTALSANYLIVGGGGGGGGGIGGGGGAGGLLSGSNVTIDSSSTYVITVGSGGSGGSASGTKGANGANSTFSAIANVTIGGGGGGANPPGYENGLNGGSGGGAAGAGASRTGGSGTTGQGYAGGNNGGNISPYPSGGGGGAGQAGFVGSGSVSGNGGNGVSSSISGVATYYAGGGGGAGNTYYGATAGTGGLGGGGNGTSDATTGGSATANTGSGGGGGGLNGGGTFGAGGSGASGVVIISYPGSTPMMAGGNVTVVSNTVVHTFTSSGYLTPFVNMNNSLRFRQSNSAYLSRTPTTAGNRKTWTWSGWVKRGALSSLQALETVANGGNEDSFAFLSTDTIRFYGAGQASGLTTNAVFRDPAAWYHVVLAMDTTQATASNRTKLYVNGIQQTFSGSDYLSQNTDTAFNSTAGHYIARYLNQSMPTGNLDGYVAELNFIDGQALSPYAFGTFNQYGVWAPVRYAGSYGTNGFYLNFGNTANTTALGYDSSPQGNNWTPTNISLTTGSTYDSMVDVPTLTSANVANYAVLNPLEALGYGPTAGNLNITSSSGVYAQTRSTIYFDVTTTTGFYAEFTVNGSLQDDAVIGIMDNSALSTGTLNAGSYNLVARGSGGGYTWWTANSGGYVSNTTVAESSGQVIGVAVKNGKLYFAINNTWVLSGNPTTESNPAFTGLTGQMAFLVKTWQSNALSANFGQRPFAYTPPTGYLPLNTYNM